jgi:ABC-type multidrug transport system fused ATPase/permease subunit
MKNNINLLKKSSIYLKPFRFVISILFFLSLIQYIISYSSSFFLGKLVDAFVSNSKEIIISAILMYLIILITPIIISRIRYIYQLKKIDLDLMNYIQKNSFGSLLDLSLGQIKIEHSGKKQDVLRSGERSIQSLYQTFSEQLIPLFASFIVALIGFYFISIKLFVTTVCFLLFYVLYGSYINIKMKEPLKLLIEKRIEKNKTYIDLLRSLFFIKFTNQKDKAISQLSIRQIDFRNFGEKIWSKYHLQTIINDILLVGYYVSIIYFIYSEYINEIITIGLIIPILSWMTMISNNASRIRDIQRRTVIELSDVEKMFNLLEQKTDLEEVSNPQSIKVFENKIAFEQVEFDYHDGKKGALHDINFEIKKGEKVALVGRSGSGKTTIVSLLLRLYDPTSGSLMIDGVELKSIVLEDWHNLIAYVPQDSDLLDISIKENILFGAKHQVTDKEIEDVLEKAGIKEFIHNLPHGVDTIVGEKGIKLSGGQKQRVCIARALIKDAPILLLDEATSSLDSETESIVNKAIWEMLGDKTGVVIAHRLSTIIDADKIIVMDDGKVIGIGTHKQLIKTTPYYKKLVDAQNVNL